MQLKFTDLFKNEISTNFGIRPSHIESLVQKPDKSQNVILEDKKELKFYTKEISSVRIPYTLLTYGRLQNAELFIDVAFKIYPDLHPDVIAMTPVQILHTFANRFGLELRVGNLVDKFIFNQTLLTGQNDNVNLISIQNPENHKFMQQAFIRKSIENNKIKIDCALVFCIDIDEYLKYLNLTSH